MKTSRAIPVLLASLAGGIGLRLAFAIPAGPGKSHSDARGETAVSASGAVKAPAPRPTEAEVIAARGAARFRLLIAWLPGAGEEELLRAAGAFDNVVTDDGYLSIRLLMVRWAEVNPRAMLEWAGGKGRGLSWYGRDAINAWARVDFDSAWAAACSVPPYARNAALLGLTVADPDKCLRLLQADPSLLSLRGGFTGMFEVLQRLAARDPAAVATLLDSAAPELRKNFADGFAVIWAAKDPAAAVAWMTALDPAIRNEVLKNSGEWIAKHAPEHLPALLEKLPAGRLRTLLQSAGLAQLAASDPDAARRQIDAMPAGPAQQYGRSLLLRELYNHGDDAGAVALASQLGWTVKREWCPSYTESLTSGGNSTGSYPEEWNIARKTMQKLMARIASKDPAQAAALLDQCTSNAVSELFFGDLSDHPAAMAEALLKTGETDDARQNYLMDLAFKWMSADPEAAITWAAAHSEYLPVFMMRWNSDPPAAFKWAAALPAEKRLPLLEGAVKSWGQERKVDIRAAISGSSLPEEEKQKLSSLVPAP